MTKPTFLKFLLPVLLLAILACGVGTPTPNKSDTLGTVVAETLTSMPVIPSQTVATPDQAIFSPIPPLPSSTPEAVGVRYVYTQAQNVNLRVNPGRLFKVSRVLAQGTKLQVLGVAPGAGWLNVVNDEGVIGWVGVDFVSGGFDGPPPPVVEPKDVLVVTGTVLDANGSPVNGIGFAVEQGGQRDDASTDETGTFYAFLPTKFAGSWTVSFVSVACTTQSPDDKCRCTGDTCPKIEPNTVTVTVPMSAPLSFVWM
ncbi:hypothetical protein ANAEL_03777 [Anaerolineales bacterium]|nr:hypothetical protein ANAEL_03777 [Anaerolineales bacterium]